MKTPTIANVALLLALAPGTASTSGSSPFRVGEPVPHLRLPSITGGHGASLADFRGEKLMLHVWASW
jgi:hypothetical protein